MLDPLVTAYPDEPSMTRFKGLQISSRIIPAAGPLRGGDWCDAFALKGGVLALSIGDVCGHGEGKYDSMVAVRQAIRNAVLRGLDPAQTLTYVDRFLQEYDPGEIVTSIVAFLDTRRRTITFANAGHPAPIMANPYGTLLLEYVADLPLGIEPDFQPAIHEINLPAATLLVFYTDGVSESGRDSIQGSLKLCAAARLARDFPELPTAATIETMMLSGGNFDDVAILTVRTPLAPMVRRNRSRRAARPAPFDAADVGSPSGVAY